MTRRTFRYAPLTVRRDETAQPTYEAECVSAEVGDCAEESGPHHGPGPVEEWMRAHTRATGHRRFLRIVSDYTLIQPPEGGDEPFRRGGGGTA